MPDQVTENPIQAAASITPKYIESAIASEHYFTAADGERFAKWGEQFANEEVSAPLCLITFCVLVLTNGDTATGESACASQADFDAEKEKQLARQNAINKIWPLEGELLKQSLAQE
ncbi:Gp49 family protein [Serratia fonticola]|uniref:Gp49 family protein n=1 Tax=Serratia fonticola TaxID=47917 RepID=UPI000428EECD|nr:Gp49 family protein [Serratia fonticola]